MGLHTLNTPAQGAAAGGHGPGLKILTRMVRGERGGRWDVPALGTTCLPWLCDRRRPLEAGLGVALSSPESSSPFCNPAPSRCPSCPRRSRLFSFLFSLELLMVPPGSGRRRSFPPTPCFGGKAAQMKWMEAMLGHQGAESISGEKKRKTKMRQKPVSATF